MTDPLVQPVLQVEDLRVELLTGEPIVEDASLSVAQGEVLGLVGESGSGKTTTALALLGFARSGARIQGGSVCVQGREVIGRSERELRRLRGKLVAYLAQDPASALNPSLRVRDQISEMLRFHAEKTGADAAVRDVLERVQLPSDRTFQRRFIHQLSGGQQQRLAIAIALVCSPPVVVMDEPTTGLDVVTQARILTEINRLRRESHLAIVYVSHDLAVVGSIADRIAVMYAGRVIEQGPAATILQRPRHPYTLGLVASIPDHVVPRQIAGIPGVAVGVGERPPGCAFAPRCPQRTERGEREMPVLEEIASNHSVRCWEWQVTPQLELQPPVPVRLRAAEARPLLEVESLRAVHSTREGDVVAADDVSFSVASGQCVALVGESGSGKTTIARCVAGLHEPDRGRVLLDGTALAPKARARSQASRRRIQIVFQNPYDSLNPRHRVRDSVARPARVLRGLSRSEAASEVAELLERVRLPVRLAGRFPAELSGGERQRVAIARALAARPDLVICDEITSALDVSVQAAVLELLAGLRRELGLSLLFISHDLGVVASIADQVLVLEQGVVRERGSPDGVLTRPSDPYTQALVDAVPSVSGTLSH